MSKDSPPKDEGLISFFDFFKGWLSLSWRLPAILRTKRQVENIGTENRESWGSMLEENAAKFPHNPAIKSAEEQLSWRQYNEAVNRCANYFISKGLKKGDVACVFLEMQIGCGPPDFDERRCIETLVFVDTRRLDFVQPEVREEGRRMAFGAAHLPAFEQLPAPLGRRA